MIPHDLAQAFVEVGDRFFALRIEETMGEFVHLVGCLLKGGIIRRGRGSRFHPREVVAHRVRSDKIAVSEALHERGGAESIGPVIGEVGFTQHEEPRDVGHQVIVYPEPTHGIVHGWKDAHRCLVGRLIGDLLVDIKKITVACLDRIGPEAIDRVAEVEIYPELGWAHSATFITHTFRRPGGNITGSQVAEAGINALQIVVAIFLGNVVRILFAIFGFLRHPNPTVITQRLGHEGKLGLIITGNRNAGRMNLRVTWIGETGALLVSPPRRRGVGITSVGGEIEYVAVAPGSHDHTVGRVRGDFAGNQVAHDDALGLSVDEDEFEHFGVRVKLNPAGTDHFGECRISAEQKLLAGLAPGVERPGDLSATEGAIGQQSAVFAGEGHALGDTLVDDIRRDLGQPVHVGLTGTVVATFDRIVEQPIHAVAVVLVILGGIDSTLRGDRVGATWAVVENETIHLIAQFRHGRGSRATGESRPHHDDFVFPLISGVDQLHVGFVGAPLLREVSWRDIRI